MLVFRVPGPRLAEAEEAGILFVNFRAPPAVPVALRDAGLAAAASDIAA